MIGIITPCPANIDTEVSTESLTIVRRWSKLKGSILILAPLFFMIVGKAIGLTESYPLMVLATVPAVLVVAFGSIHFLNRTSITVCRNRISIEHQPIPIFPRKVLPTSDVSQLFVSENVYSSQQGMSANYAIFYVDD